MTPWITIAVCSFAVFIMYRIRTAHDAKHTCRYCGGRNKRHDQFCPYAGTGL